MTEKLFDEISKFMQDKGFVYGPEPEIYGGVAGFYSYGPLGKRLKNNIENAIRKKFELENFWEVEYPNLAPAAVWEASGHIGNFFDETAECTKCKGSFRIDKVAESMNITNHKEAFNKGLLKCPNCKGDFSKEIKKHDLMMATKVGSKGETIYLRGETATTTYLPFRRYLNFFRDKLPFSVFQIGKAFRNEISPRQNLLRMREFTQAEAQIFIFKEQKNDFTPYEKVKEELLPLVPNKGKALSISLEDAIKNKLLKNKAYAYTLKLAYDLFIEIGINGKNLRLRQHSDDEKAFYADDAWDLEVNFNSLGWIECCGIHDRTDYDLNQHMNKSGVKLTADNEGKKEVPHVLEIAFGIDRPVLALIDNVYSDDVKRGNKVLLFPKKIAPVQVAVFPLVKKLSDEARVLLDRISFKTIFDESGSIGRRYARADEQGIPYCLTFDFESLDDQSVTIRDIKDTKQVRIKINDLQKFLKERLI